MKIDLFSVAKEVFSPSATRNGVWSLFEQPFLKPTGGFVTQLHPRPTESINANDRSACRHIPDSYSASFTLRSLPPHLPSPRSPALPGISSPQMLQHSQISSTDYSSYPPSRDPRQDPVKLESSDTPDLGASISNQQSQFHFGSDPSFNYTFMSTSQWKPSVRSQLDGTHPFESTNNSSRVKFDLPLLDSSSHGTQDDSYDDADVDSFCDSQPTASTSRSAASSDRSGEKHIRRRSSKGESNTHLRGHRWIVLDLFLSRSL